MKRLAILGSTGSIGVNTLDIVRQFPEQFQVISLSAGLNIGLLREQILRFQPKIVSVLNREVAEVLQKTIAGRKIEVVYGVEGLIRVATHPEVNQVVSAIVGAVGLIPTLSAIKTGHCRRRGPYPHSFCHQNRKVHSLGQQRASGDGRKDRYGRSKKEWGSNPARG